MVAKLKEMGSFKACMHKFSSLVHLIALMLWLANVERNLGGH